MSDVKYFQKVSKRLKAGKKKKGKIWYLKKEQKIKQAIYKILKES